MCRSELWVVRSGNVAFGKEVSGQPLQSDSSSISIGELNWLRERPSELSRAQIERHATNTHIKHIGSNAASNLLSGRHVPDIAKIIHIQLALRQASSKESSPGPNRRD